MSSSFISFVNHFETIDIVNNDNIRQGRKRDWNDDNDWNVHPRHGAEHTGSFCVQMPIERANITIN